MMKQKRKVSANLGRTQHRNADALYAEIKKRLGKSTRICPFYNGSKYSQFNKESHDSLNPLFPNPNVPVEEFDFAKKANGKWGLQAYCKVCYKAYRRGRIDFARKEWKGKTANGIRDWYRAQVGPTMMCSECRRELDPNKFRISLSMEKGLHNICLNCESGKATSVREQMWLSDGDWSSWKASVAKMRKQQNVVCAGWPPAVKSGVCIRMGNGKTMHADHKVPLRGGGINDAKNFQPLCDACNMVKNDQLDTRLTTKEICHLVGKEYRKSVRNGESTMTIERRLKTAVLERLETLERGGEYKSAIIAKKKSVNGQWDVERAYRKGLAWIGRGGGRVSD